MGTFKIDANDLCWINGEKDNAEDLCLHGNVVAVLGKKKIEYHATVSATALYLLKTLTENHIIHEDNQMLPCCGHFMIPDEELSNVTISGCDNGVDWSVIHEEGQIRIILEDGIEEIVAAEEYKTEVFNFADKIERFYQSCTPKKIGDEFEKNGYTAFWNEWHRRRGEI